MLRMLFRDLETPQLRYERIDNKHPLRSCKKILFLGSVSGWEKFGVHHFRANIV